MQAVSSRTLKLLPGTRIRDDGKVYTTARPSLVPIQRADGSEGKNKKTSIVACIGPKPESTVLAPGWRPQKLGFLGDARLLHQSKMVSLDLHTAHSRRSVVRAAAADLEGSPEKSITTTGSVIPAVAIACLGALLFGYHLGVVNGALDYMSGELGFRGNTAIAGLVVSITLAGAALGSVVGGNFAEKFGRTRALQINVLPLVVGTVVCATAGSTSMIIAGRLICGIGIGLASTLVPLYISEVSPPKIRGALGSVNQLAICIGILGALLAGLPLSENPGWWRTMFGIAVVPALLLGVGMAWAPESPSWLFKVTFLGALRGSRAVVL